MAILVVYGLYQDLSPSMIMIIKDKVAMYTLTLTYSLNQLIYGY